MVWVWKTFISVALYDVGHYLALDNAVSIPSFLNCQNCKVNEGKKRLSYHLLTLFGAG